MFGNQTACILQAIVLRIRKVKIKITHKDLMLSSENAVFDILRIRFSFKFLNNKYQKYTLT